MSIFPRDRREISEPGTGIRYPLLVIQSESKDKKKKCCKKYKKDKRCKRCPKK